MEAGAEIEQLGEVVKEPILVFAIGADAVEAALRHEKKVVKLLPIGQNLGDALLGGAIHVGSDQLPVLSLHPVAHVFWPRLEVISKESLGGHHFPSMF